MIFQINPLVAMGVLASTAATDSAYVFFNALSPADGACGRELERHLVSSVRLRSHQLYGKRRLRPVCGHGFVAWRIRLSHMAGTRSYRRCDGAP